MNPETHSCDCGYTWRHGHSGTHLCGPQYRATIERQEQEVLKLHRDLAAEKLRADQGWHRYEAANSRKNELEAERANWAQEIVALKASMPADENAQPVIMSEDDAEQLARSKWTVKQWYEHVGAWENAQGEVCFGSVMALGAMLKLMAKARNSAAPLEQQEAIDELIETHRILLVPEYEGGFHAMVYRDEATPLSNFHATTVRAAVEGAINEAKTKD